MLLNHLGSNNKNYNNVMADSVSNFLNLISNAAKAKKRFCIGKFSSFNWSIAKILKYEGYINDCLKKDDGEQVKKIIIVLKYEDHASFIGGIRRWSKPGCRVYYKSSKIPFILGGLGIGILATPKGLLKDHDARKENLGGEMICAIW